MGRRSITYAVVSVGLVTLAASAVIAVTRGGSQGAGRPETVAECAGADRIEFDCHERRYSELVRTAGAAVALDELATEQRRNGYVRAACHQLTHRIGRAAGELADVDALDQGSSLCASGYYHGVMQAVMGALGAAGAADAAAAICDGIREADRHSADHYNCAHGLGHGFMEVYDSGVTESLAGCRRLDGQWEREKCSGGVFMENVTAMDDPARPSTSLRPDDPLYPCTAIARHYADQCYDWQITYAVYVTDADFTEVFALCAGQERSARAACYRGVGGDVLQQSKFITDEDGREETLRRLCLLGPDAVARRSCIAGAVTNMFRDYTDGENQAEGLCEALDRSGLGELVDACREAHEDARREVALPERER